MITYLITNYTPLEKAGYVAWTPSDISIKNKRAINITKKVLNLFCDF